MARIPFAPSSSMSPTARNRQRSLELCPRHGGRDFVARPEPRPAASGRLHQGRGNHHQARHSPPRRKMCAASKPSQVIGIGVDTTGSTPLPVDATASRWRFSKKFANNPAAMAWLWKDHTGVNEAAEITALAEKMRPQYLAKCGGTYSSEWFWSKILRCLRVAPEVFDAAHSWVELADFVPAALTGTLASGQIHRRRLCRRSQGDVECEMGRLSRRGISFQAESRSSRNCVRD
jgi:hypothetical protein